jgi:hypothetical protein
MYFHSGVDTLVGLLHAEVTIMPTAYVYRLLPRPPGRQQKHHCALGGSCSLRTTRFRLQDSLISGAARGQSSMPVVRKSWVSMLADPARRICDHHLLLRFPSRSIIVIRDLSFDEWNSRFGSERVTAALIDRLHTARSPPIGVRNVKRLAREAANGGVSGGRSF